MRAAASDVSARLAEIDQRIAQALQRSGRSQTVQVIGVTKYLDAPEMVELRSAGIQIFAENRVQVALSKLEWFQQQAPGISPEAWHFIGHLQRNKLSRVMGRFQLIHSVDSLSLLESLSRHCQEQQLGQNVLLQVNISGEASKGGFTAQELDGLSVTRFEAEGIRVLGLMGMAAEADESTVRSSFRLLRTLRDRLQDRLGRPLPELSMGMSGDFEIAVEEGASLLRIGSLLYS